MSLTIKQINAKIETLAKHNRTFADEVQTLLCSIAVHAFDNKNVDPATRLLVSNPDETDVNKRLFRFDGVDNAVLIRWIEKHMPARWVQSSGAFAYNKSFKGEYDAIALLSDAWWKKQAKPKEVSSSVDMLEGLRAFIKRMEKEASRTIDGAPITVEHAEILAKLKVLANDTQYAQED